MMTKTLVWTQFAIKEGLAPKPPEFYVNEGDRLELYVVTKAKTEPPAWDGEGLPPVGARGVDGDGDIVEVVAHHHGHAVCYLVDYADHQYIDVEYSQFRPIRSEEGRITEDLERIMYEPAMTREMASRIYEAIRDGKVPGVKLEDT